MKKIQAIFFRNPSRTQIVTFSFEHKGCEYFGKCDYLGYYYSNSHIFHLVKMV